MEIQAALDVVLPHQRLQDENGIILGAFPVFTLPVVVEIPVVMTFPRIGTRTTFAAACCAEVERQTAGFA